MLEQSVLGKVWLAGGVWLCEQLCYECLEDFVLGCAARWLLRLCELLMG